MTTDAGAARTTRSGAGSRGAVRVTASRVRGVIRRSPRADRVYRAGVGVVGGATVALGVVLMPLPGPGTLISLGGLAILGTEFRGAAKVNVGAKRVVNRAVEIVRARRQRRSRQ
ncbi:PGPGW domain-containing protein [Galbitalea sp. SE-J8]|uniref:PGPGW domain-containing protein n=1 Tax=Galbitalea sp. SE-J8 TaxID=3054952 RepID=UPI00259CC6E3|nr:PGPGW domain-containing protein [Galbitalea sp. SE-J8]MDM4763560.1 PGPGW domain-containing protein [Galbitalea sp. SE-J8]